MKRLIIGKILVFTIVFSVLAFEGLAQELRGTGTRLDPYVIESDSDWETFAGNTDYWASGKHIRLDADISVGVMVGTDANGFQGTFDGHGHTLTFNIGSRRDAFNENHCAPFRYVSNASIKNLTVEGTIYTKKKYAGGFIGRTYGLNTKITDCISSIVINCTDNDVTGYDATHGGFVGEAPETNNNVTFTNCLFDGRIIDGNDPKRVQKCAGFMGWANTKADYDNCYMAGTIEINKNISHFHRNHKAGGTWPSIYYVKKQQSDEKPGPEGVRASDSYAGKIAKRYTDENGDFRYIPVQLSRFKSITVPAEPLNIDTIARYFSKTLITRGPNHECSISIEYRENELEDYDEVAEIQEAGYYRITVTGNTAKGFYGSQSVEFQIYSSESTWSRLVELITDAESGDEIKLEHDYVAGDGDERLLIDKNLTIDMNGHTINRNLMEAVAEGQVMKITKNDTVTIKNGTITGGYNLGTDGNIDGGGIYNLGHLTLSNVTVTNNHSLKKAYNTYSGRGGGIYTGQGSTLIMNDNCLISYNSARGGGGGIFCEEAAVLRLTEITIDTNTSESKGGGLRISGKGKTKSILTDCVISRNSATETDSDRASEGGGIYFDDNSIKDTLYMTRCRITGNKSSFAGAGFFLFRGQTYAKDCIITGNSAFTETDKMYGGGISLYKNTTYTMDGGKISDNSSFQDGGGIYVMQGATFNVLGKVEILDNFRVRIVEGQPDSTANNTYLAGSGVINIIGDLDSESKIRVTGHGAGGIYTNGFKLEYEDNFISDDKYQKELDSETGEFRLVPYDWENPGAWFDQDWYHEPDHTTPQAGDDVVIKRAIIIPEGATEYVSSVTFENGTVILQEGAQLIINNHSVSEAQVDMMLQKNIKAVKDPVSKPGWYIVSVPITEALLRNEWVYSTNIVTLDEFDLLRYDEPTHYWDSYTDHSASFSSSFENLVPGRGYLYRNKNDVSVEFFGTMNLNDVYYGVTYTAGPLPGFNLIGNPYTENITVLNTTLCGKNDVPLGESKQLTGYYKIDTLGSWVLKTSKDEDNLGLAEGCLIQVPAEAKKVKFSKNARRPAASKAPQESILFSVSNSKYEDKAYAMLYDCLDLNKIEHINENAPMLYIHRNGEDYAIASMDGGTRSFNLNFEANTTGRYTLSVNLEGNFDYLRLIDKVAGKEIDLLEENEYSFTSVPSDSKDRFVVRLSEKCDDDAEGTTFAYQCGTDIMVSGSGLLQVFDVMGRQVMSRNISDGGVIRTEALSKGMYILRLNGSDVKSQKIVIK